MAQGLQVWDSSGKIQVDTNTSTSTIIKTMEISSANTPMTYTNPIITANNFFYLIDSYGGWVNYYIKVTLNGSTVTIETNKPNAITMVLGVY